MPTRKREKDDAPAARVEPAAKKKAEPEKIIVADRYPFRHPLDSGDRGALVLWAQSRLAESGDYEGPLDGRFDREVTLAVRRFQSSNSLMITGVIDRRTWECLSQS